MSSSFDGEYAFEIVDCGYKGGREMEIGNQIKKFRKELELSQDELAERIFVSRQSVSNWENDKNYPDLKSLVLLSTIFNVSLDILIKGDIEAMKEKIQENFKTEDIARFKTEGNLFAVLLLVMMLSAVPLTVFGGYIGIGVWGLIAAVTICLSLRIEKRKKQFDIQTYKEILAFTQGVTLGEVDQTLEQGKRNYQKFFLALAAGVLTLFVSGIFIVWFL